MQNNVSTIRQIKAIYYINIISLSILCFGSLRQGSPTPAHYWAMSHSEPGCVCTLIPTCTSSVCVCVCVYAPFAQVMGAHACRLQKWSCARPC